jgi:hypothetical protein
MTIASTGGDVIAALGFLARIEDRAAHLSRGIMTILSTDRLRHAVQAMALTAIMTASALAATAQPTSAQVVYTCPSGYYYAEGACWPYSWSWSVPFSDDTGIDGFYGGGSGPGLGGFGFHRGFHGRGIGHSFHHGGFVRGGFHGGGFHGGGFHGGGGHR